ncbi:Inner membrane metabolite transport protein YhjE [Microbacterium oxydans]|uniref:Putative proline/betaine transporter n=1 Tax=Microbacterium oxydans TaxID=82380 RepID=A0A0F0LB60_9MICO|nr:MFS transporter [Microbacterium oxydans]KJL29545.1 Inner membrane metabolite transport protein YhjE [Microbacterium oxydans]CAH0222962.1 Inner membrane metabolite transport protein YhjE [Microbacterium oxydans]
MAALHTEITPARQRRSMIGAFVGTAIEWYDFYIFGTAAALVFGRVFYPDVAPGAALLASFATFWVGFLMRPVGGLVFGHFGDKLGRKNVLVITLMMMGIATTLIGLLPTYAQIGILAPVLLVVLRGLQGFAVGGEWGGAVLLSTENATEKKKGLAGAWVQQGSPAGSILATLMFLLVGLLPDEQFITWGWRIPFLMSAVLVIIGLVIRVKVEESPDFVAAKASKEVVSAPVLVALRTAPVLIGLGVLASVMGISNAYFSNTFLLAWTTGPLGIDRQLMLNILLGMAVLQFIWQPIAAKIAERLGIARVMLGGLVLSVLLTVPYFLAIQAASPLWITVTLYATILGSTAYYALLATLLASAFPARIRYSGVSLAYQLCATVFGGSTPLVAQWILNSTGGSVWGVAVFYAAMILLTIAGVWALQRRMTRDLAAARTEAAV